MERKDFSNAFNHVREMYQSKELVAEIAPLFQNAVYEIARRHPRDLPWRVSPSPYTVFVSEIMLQQTQAHRVAEKFPQFINAFPDFRSLAAADFEYVLRIWNGLGYNRRALFLHKAAKIIVSDFNGILPDSPQLLTRLPGIGMATASSICAFAFNTPVVFLETNIRAVYIHAFFQDNAVVDDNEIFPLAHLCLDHNFPSRWYNALMDAGVAIKQLHQNPTRKSRTYRRQEKFEGSSRQLRGRILGLILSHGPQSTSEIAQHINGGHYALPDCLASLQKEGFLLKDQKGKYYIAADSHSGGSENAADI